MVITKTLMLLDYLLKWANRRSFNCITVDGDTSTSDTVLLAATGQSARHARVIDATDPRLVSFKAALLSVMQDLAHQVVRDGEGVVRRMIEPDPPVARRQDAPVAFVVADTVDQAKDAAEMRS